MPTTTRAATTDDIPVLVGLMEEFYAEADFPLDRPWATAGFSALLGDDRLGAAWLLLRDAEPAGYVVLTVRFSMEYGGLGAIIDDLFVRPRFRRHGVGRSALDALFAECARRRVRAVHVEVGRDNVAGKGIYGSLGMRPRDDHREFLTIRLGGGEDEAS